MHARTVRVMYRNIFRYCKVHAGPVLLLPAAISAPHSLRCVSSMGRDVIGPFCASARRDATTQPYCVSKSPVYSFPKDFQLRERVQHCGLVNRCVLQRFVAGFKCCTTSAPHNREYLHQAERG
jgi:hypothetical protein